MQERARRKALFVLATGISPSEYEGLSGFEIDAFIELVNERNERS